MLAIVLTPPFILPNFKGLYMKSYLLPTTQKGGTPLRLIRESGFADWRKKAAEAEASWLDSIDFKGRAGSFALMPGAKGKISYVLAVVENDVSLWNIAHLSGVLPKGAYRPEWIGKGADKNWGEYALGWQLGTYRFAMRQKENKKEYASLIVLDAAKQWADKTAASIFLVRDLINRPANDLTPEALAVAAAEVAKKYKAKYTVIHGDALLKHNYPLVHAVGRASENAPCLIDFTWGKETHPKVTLVGKGVTFDSGGLDIKSADGMKLMKKDMGGAAQVLGLAALIMGMKLPVRLRVIIAAVENSVGSNAFRPLDVIKSRKGLTVEIGNTDAEGRLILCDALAEADDEKPDLLVDCATLTGAARVALGTELPAYFTPDDKLAAELDKQARNHTDPMWRLPLWKPYREMMNSDVADINNAGSGGYAGAITAALYLQDFVTKTRSWVHLDMMAWNLKSRPGRPQGGEAMGLRALFRLIEARYGKVSD